MQKSRRSQTAATIHGSARAIALHLLQRWRGGREFADEIFQSALAKSELSAPDRAFAQELFYGVVRNLSLLDFWIGCLRHGSIDGSTRDILRLGFYQLFLLETPEHAAVFETVAVAGKPQRALINGVLRSAVRRKEELLQSARAQPLATQCSHPDWLVERWEKEFGRDQTAELCLWNNRPAALYARVNGLRKTVPDFVRENPGSLALPADPHFVHLAAVPARALAAGDCYIQDPSTALACRLLQAQPAERILDACAAPGGKSGYLAELMQNRGEIVACDRDSLRLERLRENIERLGVAVVRPMQHDWLCGDMDAPQFDRILLDAPCTNTGVMRRRIDVRWRLRPGDFAHMREQQLRITRAVLPLLKPGGVFVYSTCSVEREENEAVVQRLSQDFPRLRLDKIERALPFRDGFDGAFAARFVSTKA